jgi:flagellar hook-length control protein FliK
VVSGAPAPAGAAPVPTWIQQAVQAQLAGQLVSAARGGETGQVTRLTLHLHPADLGAVQVVATLDDGTVSLQLMAGNPVTRDAMRAALAGLRSDLAAAGLDGTRLDVSDQPPSQQGLPQQQAGTSDGSSRSFGHSRERAGVGVGQVGGGQPPASVTTNVRGGPSATSRGVDLHL